MESTFSDDRNFTKWIQTKAAINELFLEVAQLEQSENSTNAIISQAGGTAFIDRGKTTLQVNWQYKVAFEAQLKKLIKQTAMVRNGDLFRSKT